MSALKIAALALAAKGMRIFPCVERGKEPAIAENLKRATTDPNTITGWWRARVTTTSASLPAKALACGCSMLMAKKAKRRYASWKPRSGLCRRPSKPSPAKGADSSLALAGRHASPQRPTARRRPGLRLAR